MNDEDTGVSIFILDTGAYLIYAMAKYSNSVYNGIMKPINSTNGITIKPYAKWIIANTNNECEIGIICLS